jgi:hypothetical protein
MSDAILEQTKQLAYEQGVRDALNELSEVYGDGIEETDLWNEYMTKEPKLIAFDKWLDTKEPKSIAQKLSKWLENKENN